MKNPLPWYFCAPLGLNDKMEESRQSENQNIANLMKYSVSAEKWSIVIFMESNNEILKIFALTHFPCSNINTEIIYNICLVL